MNHMYLPLSVELRLRKLSLMTTAKNQKLEEHVVIVKKRIFLITTIFVNHVKTNQIVLNVQRLQINVYLVEWDSQLILMEVNVF